MARLQPPSLFTADPLEPRLLLAAAPTQITLPPSRLLPRHALAQNFATLVLAPSRTTQSPPAPVPPPRPLPPRRPVSTCRPLGSGRGRPASATTKPITTLASSGPISSPASSAIPRSSRPAPVPEH